MAHHHLTIDDASVRYGSVLAVEHVNLDLGCGHSVGLLGPNGAGKSTLLKAIAGLVPLCSGKISYHGHERKHIARSIAYLPQRGVLDWDFPITVRGMVQMGRFPALGGWRTFGREDHTIVEQALAVTRLEALADRQINALSGGQQQRAFLARAYAQQAHVCVLDEPFTGLDTNSQADLREILKTMVGEGKLLLVSHHDMRTVPELFDQVVLLNRHLIAYGPVASTFTPQNLERTFGAAREEATV
ncbi:metal ABC transporter ATP-binding protein [soil metagenome]